MKPSEIRNMTIEEIELKLSTFKEQLFKVRQEAISGRIERPSRFKLLRRDIARCLTILNEKNKNIDREEKV